MKQEIKAGRADYTMLVFVPDPASTDGSGKTGLNAAALTVSYTRVETDNDVVVTDVTSSLSDLSALTDAHADWGVKEVSSTLAPGLYRLDLADAVIAAGAWAAVVYVMITSSAAAASPSEFILVAYDPLDTVRLGLTALPNAAADAAGGLPISDAGGLDLDAKLANTNEVTVARMGALTDWINGGRLDLILDIIAADTTTDIPALIAALQVVADAILVDTGTTLDGRIPAALTAGGNIKADALAISGDTTAADRLEALMDGTIVAQVNDVGATTTVFIADGFTEATNDHFNGRLITFISGALSGQQTDITDYVGATQTFTVTALTEAPADNDFFVIH